MNPVTKKLSLQEARPKIEYFCNYRERCQQEVMTKLYSYGLNKTEAEELLTELVRKGFVNEERFARAFAGGKFRQKKWGKTKILRELKARQISEYCIRKAMQEIDDDDYMLGLEQSAEKYLRLMKEKNPVLRKQKLIRYLLSKGFEYDKCHSIIEKMNV